MTKAKQQQRLCLFEIDVFELDLKPFLLFFYHSTNGVLLMVPLRHPDQSAVMAPWYFVIFREVDLDNEP